MLVKFLFISHELEVWLKTLRTSIHTDHDHRQLDKEEHWCRLPGLVHWILYGWSAYLIITWRSSAKTSKEKNLPNHKCTTDTNRIALKKGNKRWAWNSSKPNLEWFPTAKSHQSTFLWQLSFLMTMKSLICCYSTNHCWYPVWSDQTGLNGGQPPNVRLKDSRVNTAGRNTSIKKEAANQATSCRGQISPCPTCLRIRKSRVELDSHQRACFPQ